MFKCHKVFYLLILSPMGTKEHMACHQPLCHFEQSHPRAPMSSRGLPMSALSTAQCLALARHQGGVSGHFLQDCFLKGNVNPLEKDKGELQPCVFSHKGKDGGQAEADATPHP